MDAAMGFTAATDTTAAGAIGAVITIAGIKAVAPAVDRGSTSLNDLPGPLPF